MKLRSYAVAAAVAALTAWPTLASPLSDMMAGKSHPQTVAATTRAPAASGDAALGALIATYAKIKPAAKGYKSIWDDAQFKAFLERVIGKGRVNTLYKRWGKEGLLEMNPILDEESVGMKGIYQAEANKPHDADENMISVFFNPGRFAGDPKANTYQIYWRQTDVPGGTPKEVVWFASGKPPKVLRNDDQSHGDLKAENVLGW